MDIPLLLKITFIYSIVKYVPYAYKCTLCVIHYVIFYCSEILLIKKTEFYIYLEWFLYIK